MRRDLCHFWQRDVVTVYNAYLKAAKDRFNKDCSATPFHTITIPLNFSFKYNMNGGVCTVHLIPLNGGCAVDSRYSIVQGVGARYEAHDRDLCAFVEAILGVKPQPIRIDIEEFLKDQNKAVPVQPPVYAPVPQPAPAPQTIPYQPVPRPAAERAAAQPPVFENETSDNSADAEIAEIMKYKKLLDDGILTEEEFSAKKKKILGI